jgi:pimeloyl-ACP methyl ester carboxylesterase
MTFEEKRFTARDGLSLYYRDYANTSSALTPVLCLSGTTQNSKVYDELAEHLAKDRRVLCMDWRGHGQSEYDPDWRHYSYFVDRDDVLDLLRHEDLARVVIIGTSLGGIVTMHIALEHAHVIAGAVMNDVGPVIGKAGSARLRDNMGQPMVFDSFEAAAENMKARAEPGGTLAEKAWLERARRVFKRTDEGKIVPDMDPVYGRVFRERKRPPDWWPAWQAMADTPVLVIRGAISDILDEDVLAEMQKRKPELHSATVPGRGHCPHLDEPEALSAIEGFLRGV